MRLRSLADFHLGVRALRRDWHSGELRLLMLALIVAIAAVTSVSFLADRVGRALESNSAQMLGGDLALQADAPVPSNFVEQAKQQQLETTQTMQFPSMVSSAARSQLVSLKAVAPGYPLRGALKVSDTLLGQGTATRKVPDPGTVWVDAQVLGLLQLSPGDTIAVGDAQLKIAQVITYEPDRGIQFVNLAPRVMMRTQDLASTGLVAPGSRVRYQLLVAGPSATVDAYNKWLAPRLERGQNLSTVGAARPEIQTILTRAHQFLILVALLTVMIAAVAVALATRRFNLRHQDGIAVMRCLGATQSQLDQMLGVEFLLVALFSAAAGTLIGFGVHQGLVSLVASLLDTTLPGASWRPAQQGLMTSLLLVLGFALPPLSALRRIAPARVLRRELPLASHHRWAGYGAGLSAFFLLVLWMSGDFRLSSIVTVGFLLAFFLFALVAYAAVWALSRLRHRVSGHPSLRFALAGLAQRKSLTVAQICALSMGLMILLLLAITRTDLLADWQNTLPADTPNTFLINIQPGQYQAVRTRLEQAGIKPAAFSPMVRGRLLTINQKAINGDTYSDDRARRLAEREFNLSYMESLPGSNLIQEGHWLDLGKKEVSIESGLAATLGIKLGDSLKFDVAGQPVDVKVTSLREVKWDSFEPNFFAILSPGALKDAPASFITSFHLLPSQLDLKPKLVHEFPNLTVFDVGSILGQIRHVLDQVVQAVQILFLFTIVAGMLVLGAAFFSTRDERMQEIAILRVLGASARQLSAALRIELVLVGALAGLLASAGAVAIAWVLADRVFDFTLSFTVWPWIAGIGLGIIAAGLGGKLALNGVLNTPPLASLRDAS